MCISHIYKKSILLTATQNWVNTGSGNGLFPDGTKPITSNDVD